MSGTSGFVSDYVRLSNVSSDLADVSRKLSFDVEFLLRKLGSGDIPSDVRSRIVGHLNDYASARVRFNDFFSSEFDFC